MVATVGSVDADPNAGNVIAGRVRLSLDVRDQEDGIREQMVDELLSQAETIASKRGLGSIARRVMEQSATPMEAGMMQMLEDSMKEQGLPVRRMPSGAGHDALVMASRVPAAMLFVRSPGGLSIIRMSQFAKWMSQLRFRVGRSFLIRFDDREGI